MTGHKDARQVKRKAVRQIINKKASITYMHFIIALIWLLFVVFTGLNYFTGVKAITAGVYLILTFWYLFAWRRGDELKKSIVIVAMIASTLWCLVLWAYLSEIFPPHKIQNAGKILQQSYLLGNEFLTSFLTALLLGPLLVSVFRERSKLMSLLVFSPAFIIVTISNFNNVKKFSLSIGVMSAEFLGVISAIQISSLILNQIIKHKKSNKEDAPDQEAVR